MLLSFHLTNPKGFISEPKCVCSLRCSTHLRHLRFRLQKGAIGACYCCCCCLFPVSLILLVPFALAVHLTQTLCVYRGNTHSTSHTHRMWCIRFHWSHLNTVGVLIFKCHISLSAFNERIGEKKKLFHKREIELKWTRKTPVFFVCVLHRCVAYVTCDADYARSLAEEFPFIKFDNFLPLNFLFIFESVWALVFGQCLITHIVPCKIQQAAEHRRTVQKRFDRRFCMVEPSSAMLCVASTDGKCTICYLKSHSGWITYG